MAAAAGPKTGIGAGTYRNTGSYGTPTWTEMALVRDVSAAVPWDFGDASARATKAKLYAKTQVDLAFQLTVRADDADTAYQALVAAAMSATSVVDLLILDGDISAEGAVGVRAEFLVSISGQPQGAGDVVYTTFDLKAAPSSNGVPKSVLMGSGSTPAFTAF